MRHRFAFFAVLAALVLAAAGCAGDASSGQAAAPATTAAAPAAAGPPATHTETIRHAPKGLVPTGRREPAPGLRVTAFDGREIDLAQWKGQLVVVNFFESWCVVCRAEQDALTEVSRRFEHQVRFVGVSNHDTVSEGRKYQRDFEIHYPLANDSSGRTWAAWRVPYQPVTVVVDRQGRVAWRFDGGLEPGQLDPVLEYVVEV
ncbi:MAG TPA: TlpA disulfide reductase family protein [Actinomycetes bacterium]|jgi:peroxiredoxin|nr:TlpA disulfide reductase family protein [Actinomycetes bacterium]